jgi:hypothetical protein
MKLRKLVQHWRKAYIIVRGGGSAEIAKAGPEKAQVPSSLRHHCHHLSSTTSILKRHRTAALCHLTECHWPMQFCHANHVRPSTQPTHSDELKWWPILHSSCYHIFVQRPALDSSPLKLSRKILSRPNICLKRSPLTNGTPPQANMLLLNHSV